MKPTIRPKDTPPLSSLDGPKQAILFLVFLSPTSEDCLIAILDSDAVQLNDRLAYFWRRCT